MNVYGMLRLIATAVVFREEGHRLDVLACIDKLEELNAFGTVAREMEIVAHEHVWVMNLKQQRGPWGSSIPSAHIQRDYKECRICHEIILL